MNKIYRLTIHYLKEKQIKNPYLLSFTLKEELYKTRYILFVIPSKLRDSIYLRMAMLLEQTSKFKLRK
jgi:hypothetical protein